MSASVAVDDTAAAIPSPEEATGLLQAGKYPPNTVLLNVYDIIGANTVLGPLGIGVHHTGVEVYGTEYAFGRCKYGTGLFSLTPKTCPGHVFKESIVMGTTNNTPTEIKAMIASMSTAQEWKGSAYHLLRRNCNAFTDFFCVRIVNSPRDMPGTYRATKNDNGKPMRNADGYTRSPSKENSPPPRPGTSPGRCEGNEDTDNIPPLKCDNTATTSSTSAAATNIPRAAGGSGGRTGGVMPSPLEPLTPRWTNRIARIANKVLPESLCEKLDDMDRRAQGM